MKVYLMTNKINSEQIIYSIEMKDKWLKSILKKSRKLSALDKFWNLLLIELNLPHIGKLNNSKIYISKNFLSEMKQSDFHFQNIEEYDSFSPKTDTNIIPNDYSIYFLQGYKK